MDSQTIIRNNNLVNIIATHNKGLDYFGDGGEK